MGRDKDKKKAKDKGKKFHAPKVGKKVKAGSKGAEPEYDVAAAKERVAAKKAAREASPDLTRPIDVKVDAETNTKAHEKAKKAKAAEYDHRRAEREEEAINAKAETEKPKGDTGGSIVFDETDLGPVADAVEADIRRAVDTAPEVVETETGREFVGVDTSRRDANQARVSEVLAALAEPGLKKKAKADLEGTLVGIRLEGKLIEAEMAKAAEARTVTVVVEDASEFESAAKTVRRTKDGRPYVMLPDGSKEVIYTRMTTFIDCLEDKSALGRWYKRVVLAGAAVDSSAPTPSIVGRAGEADHVFRAGLAKLEKRLAKGKLGPGEVQAERAELEKALKTELDSLADEAFTLGEGRVKAEHGTHLHKLTELVDLGQPLPEDTSPEDLADIEAYQAAMRAYGLKVKDVEVVVVNDELKVLGTADRTLLYKAPGAARAITVVGDIKTGRIDYGAGKIAMQIGGYATSKRYDPENPTERGALGASNKLGLLIHLPAGEARCDIYEVDLVKGLAGLKLAVQVRSWRSETRTGANVFAPVEAPTS